MGQNKTHDMPPPGASLLPIDVEKAASEDARTRETRPEEDQRLPTNNIDNNKMTSSRRALLSVTLCLLFFFGLTSAGPSRWQQRVQCREGHASPQNENFQSMVDAASTDSLHNILHKTFPGRFQHGVWESEKQAIEAVHRDNAPLATAILRMAKRDDSNTTIASTSQQPTPSSTSSSAQVTPSSSSAPPVVSSSSSEPAPEPSTTSQAPPPIITTTSTTSIKSTSSSPQPSPSSTVSSTTLTTTSKARPQTVEPPKTTEQPQQPEEPMTPSSMVIVQTLTSTSDGVEIVVTQTSTVRVDPTPTAGTGAAKASPSLQNAGSALQPSGRWLMIVEAVVLGALLIFFVLA
ncbi:unnamed protein product [Sordaria macrospora k-hell]|uniref:WGS project CABT00000000 data, contig 2.11 n=1 Tax=Sordaria macrospora (strain ATCC MYA-333 / DSM 997 / K(L3346) / K-hell) TaxID=771870 RepID=F7VX01_SORMK|nr:uncharacterized protein SMAC_02621 [Sordaria macrospora k-hell]KAH7633001.1 hypothetical protein B0T09DRAFT_380491 [Sordaria sp. MPI-SDFR-AT-0083]CCC10042.1 unnamed protein product [Sordaria macrospora k-hell]